MFKHCFFIGVLTLSFILNVKGQRSYEVLVFAEHKVNIFGNDYYGIDWKISGSSTLGGQSGIGVTFLTSNNQKFSYGGGFSFNKDYFNFDGAGEYYYGILSSVILKNYKLSSLFSFEFKHRFSLLASADACVFTYQNIYGYPDRDHPGKNLPGSYERSNPGIYALALSMRFGKQFKLFNHNYLGLHVGIQSPYLFLNWEPVYYKGVNICGMVLGANYTFGWGGKKDDAKK